MVQKGVDQGTTDPGFLIFSPSDRKKINKWPPH